MSTAPSLHRSSRRTTLQMRLDAAHEVEAQADAARSPAGAVATPGQSAQTSPIVSPPPPVPPATPAAAADGGDVYPRLVEETRRQVDELADEIAQLARSDCSLAEFVRGFLDRVVSALAAQGGAVWSLSAEQTAHLEYQINLIAGQDADSGEHEVGREAESESEQGDEPAAHAALAAHRELALAAASASQPLMMPPRSGLADGGPRNDSDLLVLMAPVSVDGRVQLVAEILQRPGRGPVIQRGYLRFLTQMCELAAEYLKGHRLRQYSDRDSLWRQFEQFLTELHQGLDVRRTLLTIANEGRRVLDCDRVSVAVCRGRRCAVEAVSGLDSFDRRAQEVKRLGRLAKAVVAAGEPIWYAGDASNLPPQIEAVLHSYIDRSHARSVAVIPLARPDDERGRPRRAQPVGALIVEQLAGDDPPDLQQRSELVARHSTAALGNALDHNNLFLLPLWRALGRMRWVAEARNLPKLMLGAAIVVGLVVGMCMVPCGFDMAADGTLRPQVRRDVFAGLDGVVVDVPVEHLQQVRQGDVVARLRNTELEVEIASLLGQKTSTRERILAVQRAILDTRLEPQEQTRLNGELATLQETAGSIERMLALVREKEQRLVITAPTSGQIATWQVRDLLLRRPVQRGQSLMTVIDPRGEWQLELEVPERRMGHLAAADLDSDQPLEVTFVLATHPERRLTGRVMKIDRTAEVRERSGNSVLVRVAIDKHELPDLRDGAKVTARIHCGIRPLGYVLFHDVIETAQEKILFWF